MTERKMGWIPDDRKETRDYKYSFNPLIKIASVSDLRPQMPKIYDQLSLGSCVLNSACAAVEYNMHIMNHPEPDPQHPGFPPSRLFAYFNTRVIEGTVKEDAGCMIRDAIKSLAKDGVCSEALWNYQPNKFAVKPPRNCYKEAKKDIIIRYERLETIDDFRNALTQGYPIIFGVILYSSFEPNGEGIIPMPMQGESILGGHSMLIVGHNDEKRMFLVRNSWGDKWGIDGHCWMSYDYFTMDHEIDNWCIYYCL